MGNSSAEPGDPNALEKMNLDRQDNGVGSFDPFFSNRVSKLLSSSL